MTDYKVIKAVRNGCEYCFSSGGTPIGDMLLIAGGGSGGYSCCYSECSGGGGGGGAGGICEIKGYELSTSTITIGAGGVGCTNCSNNGGNSCIVNERGTIIVYGGGAGGDGFAFGCQHGKNGGSGGGSAGFRCWLGCPGLNCGYGSSGGYRCCFTNGSYYLGGTGGGGATGRGQDAAANVCCATGGGAGIQSDIDGEMKCYAGGGGGGAGPYSGAAGGSGCYGGGNGGGARLDGCNATTYGSGGGGAGFCGAPSCVRKGGNGCQGIAIFRYPTACGYNITGGCCYTCGDYTIHCFTSDGTLTVN